MGYFSQAYSDRKGADVWNLDHAITVYRSEQQAATVFTETTGPFFYLKSFFYLNEDRQSFQILLLLLWYGILVCTFISTNKFWHHQTVNFLFTPKLSLQHTLFQTTAHYCLHKSYGKHLLDVFIIIWHLHVQRVYLDNVLSATQVLPQFHRQQHPRCSSPLPMYTKANYTWARIVLCVIAPKKPRSIEDILFSRGQRKNTSLQVFQFSAHHNYQILGLTNVFVDTSTFIALCSTKMMEFPMLVLWMWNYWKKCVNILETEFYFRVKKDGVL